MKKMNFIFLSLVAFASKTTFAFQPPTSPTLAEKYYGAEFFQSVLHQAHDDDVKKSLKKILKSVHMPTENSYDQIADNCDSQKKCVSHVVAGYDRARKFLFGTFYLVSLDASHYGIKEMYCDRVYQSDDFKKGSQPGPGIVPDNTVINVEHTWPQSKFSRQYPKEMQKSDMHHLFPTDSVMNSLRGNTLFGEVEHDHGSTKCPASRYGSGTAGGMDIFEPPTDHKGRVARALFYFSVRYDLPIKPEEEVVLKKWNHEHPVDPEEASRNNEISKIQNNRNPFVDYPELADQISDF